jgi:hypothetical protein
VFGDKRYDDVRVPPDRRIARDLGDLHGKAKPLDSEPFGAPEHLARAARPPEMERIGAPLERHRPHQADHAEHVVCVEMREENVTERERDAEAHHLPLRPFAAIEEQGLPFAHERHGGDVALHRRARRGRAEKPKAQ